MPHEKPKFSTVFRYWFIGTLISYRNRSISKPFYFSIASSEAILIEAPDGASLIKKHFWEILLKLWKFSQKTTVSNAFFPCFHKRKNHLNHDVTQNQISNIEKSLCRIRKQEFLLFLDVDSLKSLSSKRMIEENTSSPTNNSISCFKYSFLISKQSISSWHIEFRL